MYYDDTHVYRLGGHTVAALVLVGLKLILTYTTLILSIVSLFCLVSGTNVTPMFFANSLLFRSPSLSLWIEAKGCMMKCCLYRKPDLRQRPEQSCVCWKVSLIASSQDPRCYTSGRCCSQVSSTSRSCAEVRLIWALQRSSKRPSPTHEWPWIFFANCRFSTNHDLGTSQSPPGGWSFCPRWADTMGERRWVLRAGVRTSFLWEDTTKNVTTDWLTRSWISLQRLTRFQRTTACVEADYANFSTAVMDSNGTVLPSWSKQNSLKRIRWKNRRNQSSIYV